MKWKHGWKQRDENHHAASAGAPGFWKWAPSGKRGASARNHALSYPLGSWFHVPHGHANALLLPHVLRFNLSAAPERYRDIALAMGVAGDGSVEAVADARIRRLCDLIEETGLEMRMSALGIRENDIPAMAKAACGITGTME